MSRRLLFKLIALVGVVLALLVPLSMMSGLLSDRAAQRTEAERSVMVSTSGPQRISGLVLAIPYRVRKVVQDKVPTKELVRAPGLPLQPSLGTKTPPAKPEPRFVERTVIKVVTKEVFTDHELLLVPDDLQISGRVDTTVLWRGLYPVRTFVAKLKLSGSFKPALAELAARDDVHFGTPRVVLGVGDVRGFRQAPTLTWQGRARPVAPGTSLSALGSGIHAELPGFDPRKAGERRFSMPLSLAGTGRLSFTPLGRSTTIRVSSDWRHPSFDGRFLPTHRSVDEAGFSATWRTSELATDLGGELRRVEASGNELGAHHDVGVALLEPVDAFRQIERATKYDLLFVLLTFAAFLLFEVLRKLRIHPLQYALVGTALAMFYLLLIALSEHLPFAQAYGIAAAACVGLIGAYLGAVLDGWGRALGFSGALSALYGALFGILQSEDHALLMGTALLFAVLAAVMLLTRNVDWYGLGKRIPPPPAVGQGG